MPLEFKPVRTPEDIRDLASLARGIWLEYWASLIGPSQAEYMYQRYQSEEVITENMGQNGYEYWFLQASDGGPAKDGLRTDGEGRVVGFTGGRVEPGSGRYFISKLYLLKGERGKHFASEAFGFYEGICRERGLSAMYLKVFKQNELALRAYRGKGFQVIGEVESDIGNGFILDDYIMEKKV